MENKELTKEKVISISEFNCEFCSNFYQNDMSLVKLEKEICKKCYMQDKYEIDMYELFVHGYEYEEVAENLPFTDDRGKIYFLALQKYGKNAQILTCVEELAELQKELLKHCNRNKENKDNIIDEMADVEIMIEQLYMLLKINRATVINKKEEKLKRLNERVK